MLTPVRHKLHIDSMGWTGSTAAGGVDADVVAVNLFDIDNEIKNVSRLKGKVAMMVTRYGTVNAATSLSQGVSETPIAKSSG